MSPPTDVSHFLLLITYAGFIDIFIDIIIVRLISPEFLLRRPSRVLTRTPMYVSYSLAKIALEMSISTHYASLKCNTYAHAAPCERVCTTLAHSRERALPIISQ